MSDLADRLHLADAIAQVLRIIAAHDDECGLEVLRAAVRGAILTASEHTCAEHHAPFGPVVRSMTGLFVVMLTEDVSRQLGALELEAAQVLATPAGRPS